MPPVFFAVAPRTGTMVGNDRPRGNRRMVDDKTVADHPLELPAGQLSALQAAYATPPRAYHDLRHVHEVLHHYHSVAAGPGWVQPDEVRLAVLYHDAVHEPGSGDNEARSAELAT